MCQVVADDQNFLPDKTHTHTKRASARDTQFSSLAIHIHMYGAYFFFLCLFMLGKMKGGGVCVNKEIPCRYKKIRQYFNKVYNIEDYTISKSLWFTFYTVENVSFSFLLGQWLQWKSQWLIGWWKLRLHLDWKYILMTVITRNNLSANKLYQY